MRFHFHLRSNGMIHVDQDGTELPDIAAARVHATDVAEELMSHSGYATCHWSLSVTDDGAHPQFDLYFADVDPRLAAFAPQVRMQAETTCRRIAALIDVTCVARATLAESAILRARSRGKPQLAYARGK
jgi:hypothetical protein